LNNAAEQAALEREMRGISCLRYPGALPLEEVNALLAKAAVFVNTSRAEGFPNTFIQAWMREVPVLSLQVNPDNVLERHQVGICAQNNHDRMKEELLNLLEHPVLRHRIGRRARKYAESRHSLDNADELIRLFDEFQGGNA
jgi:glycosyltransferase involved in cell wall biosynthesis